MNGTQTPRGEDLTPAFNARLRIPLKTYLGVILAMTGAIFFWRLTSVLVLLFLAMLIGMTLFSAEMFLKRHGWKRWLSLTFLISATLAAIGSIVFILIPEAFTQISEVISQTGDLRSKLAASVPKGMVHDALMKTLNHPMDSLSGMGERAAAFGAQMMGGFYDTAFVLVIAIYMLIDGPRAYRWFMAYFSEEHRNRIDQTVEEVRPIVSSYILGQAITSALAGVFTYGIAELLGVPGALTLGILAAVLDILPIIGIVAMAVCAGTLALTVSANAAITIVLSFLAYHTLEAYVLVPFIYGKRLKLSTLTVLLSLVVAQTLAGLPGMIAVLPLIAAYPAIEKLWLRKIFSARTVGLHQAQLAESEKMPTGLSDADGVAGKE